MSIETTHSIQFSKLLIIYRFCLGCLEKLQAAISRLQRLINALFVGFWLGVLDRQELHLIDQIFYDGKTHYEDKDYLGQNYNLRGLWDWEDKVIGQYFQNMTNLMLIGAGGGREVIALHRLGYEVDGFECNQTLVETANRLLKEQNIDATISKVDRDKCPNSQKIYDGLIVGWGSYMLIQGREHRIALLKTMRALVSLNAPILISFFCCSQVTKHNQMIATFGNFFRRILHRDPIEAGDVLLPWCYVHYFLKEEIELELNQAGFELVYFSDQDYGHAVGLAA
jgi:hypothetical protein